MEGQGASDLPGYSVELGQALRGLGQAAIPGRHSPS